MPTSLSMLEAGLAWVCKGLVHAVVISVSSPYLPCACWQTVAILKSSTSSSYDLSSALFYTDPEL